MGNEQRSLLGRDVLASDGVKLGHVADVYVDPGTGAPKWLVVPTGLLATTMAFVPAEGAGEDDDGRVVIAYTRKHVRKAPHPNADGDLSEAEEADLERHFLAGAATRVGAEVAASAAESDDATVETDLASVRDDDATEEWLVAPGSSESSRVRAEEELEVTSNPRPTQRARLVKRVVTEEVTFTVPVRKEVLRLHYEDITEDEHLPAPSVEPFSAAPDQEIVLYAEIVEYERKVVPKERVRLQKETVQETVDLRTNLRKETVDVVDAPGDPHSL